LKKIESVYHSALEKEPGERPAYLAGACAQDSGLRREVESLLGCADVALMGPVATARVWSPGFHIGPYEILGQLGAGGMGVVYRALDTKLRRKVAIKVLPPEFQSDPSRLARFEREAQLVAALNHPRIAAIYGLEVVEEIRFLVLELVEGPTLAERLVSGRIEIGEALRIGVEIAEGLEAVHDKGVIHLDLKPGNIKLTADGRVKILDFGLAKAVGEPTLADPISPTMTMPPSVAGLILGTPAYMSPEQAQGKKLDKRTGHLVVRRGDVRDADGKKAIHGRVDGGHSCGCAARRAGLGRAPDWHAAGNPQAAPPVSGARLQTAAAGYRGGAYLY
jgi:serine/threonine protein kinase